MMTEPKGAARNAARHAGGPSRCEGECEGGRQGHAHCIAGECAVQRRQGCIHESKPLPSQTLLPLLANGRFAECTCGCSCRGDVDSCTCRRIIHRCRRRFRTSRPPSGGRCWALSTPAVSTRTSAGSGSSSRTCRSCRSSRSGRCRARNRAAPLRTGATERRADGNSSACTGRCRDD